MAVDKTVRINNVSHDWGSVIIRIAGKHFDGITSIEYNDKRERKKVQGATRSRRPISRTAGNYSTEKCMINADRITLDALLLELADSEGYCGDRVFPITVQYVTHGALPKMDTLHDCTLESPGKLGGSADDAENIKAEGITFDVGYITRGRHKLYAKDLK